jgi:hypothetical protein
MPGSTDAQAGKTKPVELSAIKPGRMQDLPPNQIADGAEWLSRNHSVTILRPRERSTPRSWKFYQRIRQAAKLRLPQSVQFELYSRTPGARRFQHTARTCGSAVTIKCDREDRHAFSPAADQLDHPAENPGIAALAASEITGWQNKNPPPARREFRGIWFKRMPQQSTGRQTLTGQ